MNVLDLFSGIGGFSVGLERAGMKTVAFCELDRYCRAVLHKHWPDVPIFGDISTLTRKRLIDFRIPLPDLVCGGFPCQDISSAGKGAGLDGSRSALWWEMHRVIKETKPEYAIVENVSALRSRGLDRVLGSLAEIGYDAEWHCIPAAAVGAPHRRDRIWIVAYPQRDDGGSRGAGRPAAGSKGQPKPKRALQDMADANSRRRAPEQHAGSGATTHSGRQVDSQPSGADVADPECIGPQGQGEPEPPMRPTPRFDWQAAWSVDGGVGDIWLAEPNVGRVAHGVPSRVDRLRCLGNAVVPQIPEIIGRAIMEDAA